MDLSRSVAPLRHRQFALLWSGAFVSNIGTWMEAVAVGILVQETTGQAAWTGLVAAANFVPAALVGPFGGALADRVPRRRLLIATTSVQTVLAGILTLLAATGTPSPGVVAGIVFLAGCTQSLGFPAFNAILPDLVPEEEIVGAVALSSAQWNLGRVVGPALAGVVIATGGYSWAFAVNTASFLAVIAVLLILRLPTTVPHDGSSIFGSIRQGLRFVRNEPGLRVVVGYMTINSLLAAPFIALIPTMALEVLDGGPGATSALVTAQGIGAVTMALSLGILVARLGSRRVMLSVLYLLPVSLIVYASSPTLAFAVGALLVVGFLYLGALSSFTSIAQLRSPSAVRGRVMSVLMVLLGSVYPLGAVIQGALADAWGLRIVTAGSAALMLMMLVVARVVRPAFSQALDTPLHGEADPVPLPPGRSSAERRARLS
ncbi:MAG: MFS transporter [Acidimicrobiia bacterium]